MRKKIQNISLKVWECDTQTFIIFKSQCNDDFVNVCAQPKLTKRKKKRLEISITMEKTGKDCKNVEDQSGSETFFQAFKISIPLTYKICKNTEIMKDSENHWLKLALLWCQTLKKEKLTA